MREPKVSVPNGVVGAVAEEARKVAPLLPVSCNKGEDHRIRFRGVVAAWPWRCRGLATSHIVWHGLQQQLECIVFAEVVQMPF